MEEQKQQTNYPGVVDQKEIDSLNNILKELNIEETNSPKAPTKPVRYTSFGGRVRISVLTSSDAEKWIGKIINVGGWVKSLREGGGKSFCFIDLNDGSTVKNFQIIVDKDVENFNELLKEGIGSCIQFRGEVVKSPGNKQPIEMKVSKAEGNYVKILGSCDQGKYPLMTGKEAKKMKLETLRDICHLRPRTNVISCVTRIRNNLAYATHIYFQNRGFLYIHTPEITSSDCEGAGSMFQVTTLLPPPKQKCDLKLTKEGLVDYKYDFFSKATYLTVSGQLEVENFACAMCDVYTFGPTFRAEVSHTSRHLAEFWMIEPEMCFADLQDDMNVAEEMIKYTFKYVLDNCPEEIEFFNNFIDKDLLDRLNHVINSDFARVTYTDAVKELEKYNDKFEYKVSWGIDLQTEHERFLCEQIYKKPVFVTDYPKDIKAFYMKQNPDGKTVAASDLLVPGIGEIIGGSQREEDYNKLLNRMKELNMPIENYGWYLDLRKYGSCVHSGFGLGFERAIMYLTGMQNIRDVIPFPRTPKNCDF